MRSLKALVVALLVSYLYVFYLVPVYAVEFVTCINYPINSGLSSVAVSELLWCSTVGEAATR